MTVCVCSKEGQSRADSSKEEMIRDGWLVKALENKVVYVHETENLGSLCKERDLMDQGNKSVVSYHTSTGT